MKCEVEQEKDCFDGCLLHDDHDLVEHRGEKVVRAGEVVQSR